MPFNNFYKARIFQKLRQKIYINEITNRLTSIEGYTLDGVSVRPSVRLAIFTGSAVEPLPRILLFGGRDKDLTKMRPNLGEHSYYFEVGTTIIQNHTRLDFIVYIVDGSGAV